MNEACQLQVLYILLMRSSIISEKYKSLHEKVIQIKRQERREGSLFHKAFIAKVYLPTQDGLDANQARKQDLFGQQGKEEP